MDISCIISSGDLELYVLGMLSEEDNIKVARLSELFPEIKKEIDDIEQSLLQISNEADATDAPSPEVKKSLFETLRSLPTEEISAKTNNTMNVVDEQKEAKVIPIQRPRRVLTSLALAASVIALIACAAVISHLASANKHYHEVADNMTSKATQLQQNALTLQQNLNLYQDTNYQKINLTHAPGKPEALVQLFWNKSTHRVYAADISLPNAPAGKQYQLWAIVDGKPVNAGMMNTKKTPQQMFDFAKADAFAITLEKAGGSPTPTMTELYVLGKTS